MSALVREGRVWTFGDHINTDLVFPNRAFRLPEPEQSRLVFSANRPGWVDQVRPGDLLVAGENFGMGSGRQIGRLLKACGIEGVVADSMNGLGLRNCVNWSLPALACRGVSRLFEDGQVARVDYVGGRVTNVTTGVTLETAPLPPLLVDVVLAGGVIAMLVREGYIEPAPRLAPTE